VFSCDNKNWADQKCATISTLSLPFIKHPNETKMASHFEYRLLVNHETEISIPVYAECAPREEAVN